MNKILGLVLCGTFLLGTVFSQNSTEDSGSSEASVVDEAARRASENLEDAKRALQFGIDSTVLGVLKQAKDGKDQRLTNEAAGLMESPNIEVRIAVMDYFLAIDKGQEIEGQVKEIVENYEQYDDKLLVRSIKFLRESKASIPNNLAKTLEDILTFKEKDVQVAVLELYGALSVPGDVEIMRTMFDKPGTSPELQTAIITNLGKKKNQSLSGLFREIIEDSGEEKELRRAALTALGLLADVDSLPIIERAITSADIFERAAAIASLEGYQLSRVERLYRQALRDSAWRNRVTVITTIKEKGYTQFTEAISYLAEKDPERPVRQAAIQAMVGFDNSWTTINRWLGDSRASMELKVYLVNASAKEHATDILPGLRAIIDQEKSNAQSLLLEGVARELASANLNDTSIYEALITHPKASIRTFGIRGYQTNKLVDLRPRLEALLVTTTEPAVKAAIQDALKTP